MEPSRPGARLLLVVLLVPLLAACGAVTTNTRGDAGDSSAPWDTVAPPDVGPLDTVLLRDTYTPPDVDAGPPPTCGRPLIGCVEGGAWVCRDLQNDPNNCGSCGWSCRGACPCERGACVPMDCPAGRGDCNGSCTDGCETDLLNDPNHCGNCGLVCAPGQGCRAGACVGMRDAGRDVGFDVGRDTGIDTYRPFCLGQNVCQHYTSGCTARNLGIFWNGLQCVALMGCACIGLDCSSAYRSLSSCEAARAGCPTDAGGPPMSCGGGVECPFGSTCVVVTPGGTERRCVPVFEPTC